MTQQTEVAIPGVNKLGIVREKTSTVKYIPHSNIFTREDSTREKILRENVASSLPNLCENCYNTNSVEFTIIAARLYMIMYSI